VVPSADLVTAGGQRADPLHEGLDVLL